MNFQSRLHGCSVFVYMLSASVPLLSLSLLCLLALCSTLLVFVPSNVVSISCPLWFSYKLVA